MLTVNYLSQQFLFLQENITLLSASFSKQKCVQLKEKLKLAREEPTPFFYQSTTWSDKNKLAGAGLGQLSPMCVVVKKK